MNRKIQHSVFFSSSKLPRIELNQPKNRLAASTRPVSNDQQRPPAIGDGVPFTRDLASKYALLETHADAHTNTYPHIYRGRKYKNSWRGRRSRRRTANSARWDKVRWIETQEQHKYMYMLSNIANIYGPICGVNAPTRVHYTLRRCLHGVARHQSAFYLADSPRRLSSALQRLPPKDVGYSNFQCA